MAEAVRKRISEHETRDSGRDSLDFHASDPRAWGVLHSVERERLARMRAIHEMACGDGALVGPMRDSGYTVIASDIKDRGCPDARVADYLRTGALEPGLLGRRIAGITNPPFSRAEEFIVKACADYDYVAMLLRLRFLGAAHYVDGNGVPAPFNRENGVPIWSVTRIPCARVILPPGRFKPMHREGYVGKKIDSSFIDFAWFVWERGHSGGPVVIRAPRTAEWGGADATDMTIACNQSTGEER